MSLVSSKKMLLDARRGGYAVGAFNAENTLAAIAVCSEMGVSTDTMKEILKNVSVRGRVELVKVSEEYSVMLDYAHNGMALKSLLSTLPSAWDDTKLLGGYPGEYALLAREKDGKWYIAGINGTKEQKTISFDLSRIGLEKARLTLFLDAVDGKSIEVIDFKDGMVLTAIPLSWFRKVTDFIKGIGGSGVATVRDERGIPTVGVSAVVGENATSMNDEMPPYSKDDGTKNPSTPFDGDGVQTNTRSVNGGGTNEDNDGCVFDVPTRIENPLKDGSTTERDKSKVRMFFRSFGKSKAGITAAISKEVGYKDFAVAGSYDTAEEVGSFPTDEVTQDDETLWEIGDVDESGKPKGAKLLVIFKGEWDRGHNTYAARLELTSDGRISKIVAVADTGMALG